MNDERTNALTDMAYYNGGRHVLAALNGGMEQADLMAEMEARVAPARKWLAENRAGDSK
jgi:hypothetical protein